MSIDTGNMDIDDLADFVDACRWMHNDPHVPNREFVKRLEFELGTRRRTKVDTEIRTIANMCSFPFDQADMDAPIGSDQWWHFACTVAAVAHNKRVITTHTRNGVMDDSYNVWQDCTR